MSIETEGLRGDIIRGLIEEAKGAGKAAERALSPSDDSEFNRHITRKYAFLEIAEKMRRGWPSRP